MKNRLAAAVNAFFVAVMFALAAWVIYALPDGGQVAIHWGADGNPDAWVGASAGQLVNPIVALVLWFVLTVFPQGVLPPEKLIQPVHVRFARVFLIQLAIQMLIAIHSLGQISG